MINYVLGIFAKHLKSVDKKDVKSIASSSLYSLALVLLLVNNLFFHDKYLFLSLVFLYCLRKFQLFQILRLLVLKGLIISQK